MISPTKKLTEVIVEYKADFLKKIHILFVVYLYLDKYKLSLDTFPIYLVQMLFYFFFIPLMACQTIDGCFIPIS